MGHVLLLSSHAKAVTTEAWCGAIRQPSDCLHSCWHLSVLWSHMHSSSAERKASWCHDQNLGTVLRL